MLPDRVSNPGPTPDLRVRCPTDCATRPGLEARSISKKLYIFYKGMFFFIVYSISYDDGSINNVCRRNNKGENLRHDHVLITVNIFSIKRK